ncbi:MAG: hypothetical protein ACFFG0_09515 [Candidatus Thorarchaeota archaeon]
MKKKLLTVALVFVISGIIGFNIPNVQAQAGFSNIDVKWSGGNQIYYDTSTGNTIYTIQASGTSTYSDGVYYENDEGFIELPITDAYAHNYSGTVAKDGTSSPGLATNDGCPSLVWANTEAGETYAVLWQFRIPHDFRDGTDLSVQIGVSTASATSGARFNFYMLENKDGTAFDTSGVFHMMSTVSTDANTKLDVISADASNDDPDVADIYTLVLFLENGLSISGNVELKHCRIKYHRQFNN